MSAMEDEAAERGLRTIRAYDAVRHLRGALSATTARLTGYDWNSDPDGVTKQQGDAFAAADRVFTDLSAAVDSFWTDPTDEEWEAALSEPQPKSLSEPRIEGEGR